MRYMKTYLSVLALCLACHTLPAQTLTLTHIDQALETAHRNNPELAAARAGTQLKQSERFLAESQLYPQITGFAAADYNARLPVQPVPAEIFGGAPGTYKELRFGLPWNLNAGADLSMPLIKASQWFELSAAAAEVRIAETEAALRTENIRIQTAQAYFSVMASAALEQQALRRMETAAEVARIAREKYEAGQNAEAEKIRAENLKRAAAISYNNTVLESGNALRNLQQLLQQDGLQVQDSLDTYTKKESSALPAVNERPSLIAYTLRNRSCTLQTRARLADFFPSLSLSGRYAYYYQSDRPFSSSAGDITYDQAIIGARLQVPVFGGARNYGRLKQARIAAHINEWQLQNEKSRLEKEHAGIVQEQQTLRDNYRLALEREKAAAAAERISMKRYSEGLISFTEYAETFYEHVQTGHESLQTAARLAYLMYLPQLLKNTSDEK